MVSGLKDLIFSEQSVLAGVMLLLLLLASDGVAWRRPGNLQQVCGLRYDPCLAAHLTVLFGLLCCAATRHACGLSPVGLCQKPSRH